MILISITMLQNGKRRTHVHKNPGSKVSTGRPTGKIMKQNVKNVCQMELLETSTNGASKRNPP